MSLNPLQIQHTKKELRKNFELTGLSKSEIANDLKISEVKLEKIFNLKQRRLEDPWILRNYLLEKVEKTGQQPVPFTALAGDWHRHWFLDSNLIDQRQMSEGDN
ncbi:DUF2316 family protein [Lactococcus taiwanensis]|uniref:DUF2316 family protein n=1 Tax=Lactococcus taiwanensis TaxID=1151742 RepID=UPI0007B2C0B9|nr:DUF2316 family protein [uncultured Lactococcus sp.]KZK38073.1 hypothetical protein P7266_0766 [Lactococcus cremoris]